MEEFISEGARAQELEMPNVFHGSFPLKLETPGQMPASSQLEPL